jgi:hypothetical protein
MSVPTGHSGQVKKLFQSALPSANRRMKLRCSCPKDASETRWLAFAGIVQQSDRDRMAEGTGNKKKLWEYA